MSKLVAAYACRMQGSRLYGKPLQNLDVESGTTILDHMIEVTKTLDCVHRIVIGIAEGDTNRCLVEFAEDRKIDYIIGDEVDVLKRLIDCGEAGRGTDIFRVTTESPYFYFEAVGEAWERHKASGNAVTVVDGLPEGAFFEIFSMDALRRSHERGGERHRSEIISLYIREHLDEFKIEVVSVPTELERIHDLRLTVDHPEDLVLCRAVYGALRDSAPKIRLADIISFLDNQPQLRDLVSPYVVPERLW